MTQFAVALAVVGVCWFVGIGLLASSTRLSKIPSAVAPVAGFAVVALFLEVLRLLPGSSWPLVVGLLIPVFGAAVVWVRLGRRGELLPLLAAGIPGLAAAIVVAGAFVVPWLLDGSLGGAIHFTSNHDAYHFSSGAQWLVNHSSLDPPNVTATPQEDSSGPAYSAGLGTLTFPLRDGLELVFASVLSVTRLSAYEVWPGLAASMGGLIAASATGLAEFGRASRLLAVLGGVAVGLAAMSSFQIANQNGASMAGSAIAITILVLWACVISDPEREFNLPALILSGVVSAAFVAVYWEGFPAIALALVLALLAAIPKVGVKLLLARLMTVAVVTVVVGAVGLWIAVRSVVKLGTHNPPGWISPFSESPLSSGIAWIFGTARYKGSEVPLQPSQAAVWLAVTLLVLAVLGIALSLAIPRLWPITIGVLGAFIGGWWWWGIAAPNGYTHRRFVEFASVVVLAIAMAGWAALPALRDRHLAKKTKQQGEDDREDPSGRPDSKRRWTIFTAVPIIVLALSICVSTMATARVLDYKQARGYGTDYSEVAALLSARDGDLLVVAPSLVNQAWIGLAVADRPGTQFLVPCACIVGATMEPYIDDQRPDWILLERKAGSVEGDARVVARSGSLQLYEVGRGRVVVTAQNLQGETETVIYPKLPTLEAR